MLSISDVYDFYGLSVIDEKTLDTEPKQMYTFFLTEIRDNYIKTLKRRIKEEAGYLGLDVEQSSIEIMVKKVSEKLNDEIKRQSTQMAAMGKGFDMMSMIKAQHAAKVPGMENAAEQFRSDKGKSRGAFGGEPWAKISEAFLAIERAQTPKEIVLSVDHLNDLQHNCCHVIFDLTGTRGGGGSSHADVQAVLDEKFSARSPKDYASKMSSDVRKFLKEQKVI